MTKEELFLGIMYSLFPPDKFYLLQGIYRAHKYGKSLYTVLKEFDREHGTRLAYTYEWAEDNWESLERDWYKNHD